MKTFSNAELADIIENDGIGYAIEWTVGVERIEDPDTREMWAQARTLLGTINQRCFDARALAEDNAP
ncbi:hypothetical protein [Paenibacillus sp. YN15]|uniref:hypothetical protein n=1 Tax=Paenibacillus sp. YN15 TaxID=1742774 RepID=UPI000DCB67DC|nr:hypothetical protein [Paenibacillus sp. YN15]RAU96811.1 hypothetical protein DQG13_19850 [Paenibacillus sp. YN15]